MHIASLFWDYLLWHYSRAYRELFHIERTILWFLYHFFSLPELIRTYFSPWKRLGEEYGSIFHPEAFFESLATNIIMRIVGIIMRTIVIVAGVVVIILAILFSILLVLIWTLMPLLVCFAFLTGFVLTLVP